MKSFHKRLETSRLVPRPIGTQTRKGTTSFSCYVQDRNDNIYSLWHHMCTPITVYGKNERVSVEQLEEILPEGTVIAQPSEDDLRFLIHQREEFIEQLGGEIERLENSKNRDREYRRLERARGEHQEQQNLIIQLKEANTAFGKSPQFYGFASTTSGQKGKQLWDYLLMNVEGQRMGGNIVDPFFCTDYC